MDDVAPASPADTAALDPTRADPRELMRTLLPPARAEYAKAWELLADAGTPLARRRVGRERAKAIAADHSIVAGALREREPSLSGDDLLNARHLADELERHVGALGRIASISPVGLVGATDLRPEALGCGKGYRDPSRGPGSVSGTRGVSNRPRSSERDGRSRGRGGATGR